jgi:hypothetical protein
MSKKLIAIPAGNLLRSAATKDVATLLSLKEKTGVDRKTLRAINTGQPVKETTLQRIADKLRVPLAHLLGPSTLDEVENSSSLAHYHLEGGAYHFREIELQQLDAAALRRLVDEIVQITWFLKIDQMSESLEATLLKLRDSLLKRQAAILLVEDPGADDNLVEQIEYTKMSADLDKSVEQLAEQNLKIYGGTYVLWDKKQLQDPYEDFPLPILIYTSRKKVALSIAPERKNNSTVRVTTGWEPPQKFIESELAGINLVEVDSRKVWSRDENSVPVFDDDEIPF